MKKKLIAVSLITAMVICNSMTVWANDTWSNSTGTEKYTVGTDGVTTNGTNNGTHNVTATFTKANTATYSVTISWGDLTYGYAGKVEWDSTNYVYNAVQTGTNTYNEDWSYSGGIDSGDSVTINNNSDKKVKATFSFEENGDYLDKNTSTIDATFTGVGPNPDTEFTLGSKAISGSGDITDTIAISLSGYPLGIKPVLTNGTQVDVTSGVNIGTVTITLVGVN